MHYGPRRTPTWQRGERHPGAKLSAAQVRELRARRRAGEPLRRLAADYGVSVAQAFRVASGEHWRDGLDKSGGKR